MKMLSLLQYHYRPFTRVDLLNEMNEQEIGRTAAYRAINALADIGLLKESRRVRSGKRVLNTYLTEKGLLIADKIIELEKILEEQQIE
jgi:Fe2+ or Zn2+ uptake regulation protein